MYSPVAVRVTVFVIWLRNTMGRRVSVRLKQVATRSVLPIRTCDRLCYRLVPCARGSRSIGLAKAVANRAQRATAWSFILRKIDIRQDSELDRIEKAVEKANWRSCIGLFQRDIPMPFEYLSCKVSERSC